MALQRQNVPVQFQGVDTKTDEKSLPLGALVTLENMQFKRPGKLMKAPGATALATTVYDTEDDNGDITAPSKLINFNGELLLLTRTNIYSWSGESSAWIDKGLIGSVPVENRNISKNTYPAYEVVSTYCNGYRFTFWRGQGSVASAGVNATIIDNTTGAVVVSGYRMVGSAEDGLRVATNGTDEVVVMIASTNKVQIQRIDVSATPSVSTTWTNIATDRSTSEDLFDLVYMPTAAQYVVAYSDNGSDVTLGILNGTYDGFSATLSPGNAADEALEIGFSEFGANDKIYMAYSSAANGVRVYIAETDLSSGTDYGFAASVNARNLGVIVENISSVPTAIIFAEDQSASSNFGQIVKIDSITYAGAAATNYDQDYPNMCLASRPFWGPDGKIYCVFCCDSINQPTYYLVRFHDNSKEKFVIVSCISKDFSLGRSKVPNAHGDVVSIDGTRYLFSNIFQDKLVAEGGEIFAEGAVQESEFIFDVNKMYDYAVVENQLLIGGGMVHIYDTHRATEYGFTNYPDFVEASETSGSTFGAGETYSYKIVLEWEDARGFVHQSAPSAAVSITTTGSTNITLGGMNLALSRKYLSTANQTGNSVKLVVYRTTNGGTIYYRTVEDGFSSTATNFLIEDAVDDSEITDNEILYTTGGALEYIHQNSAQSLATYRDRVVFTNCDDPNKIAYTNQYSDGNALTTNPALNYRINSGTLGVRAGIQMDSYFILFKDDSIWYQVGSGPTASGLNNDYVDPQPIPTDVGCPYPRSIVEFPGGVFFKSKNGFCVLDRGLQVQKIGAPVEAYDSDTVTGAVLRADESEIRIATDARELVYNYEVGQWAVYTSGGIVSIEEWDDTIVRVDSAGEVLKESALSGTYPIYSTYLVDSAANLGKIKTGWIKVAGLKGLKRVYAILFTGEYYSAHGLTVKLYYDYSTTATDTFTYTGASSWDFEVRPTVQQVEAIQIEITETNSGPTDGAGFDLTGITLVCGFSPGDRVHLPVSKRVNAD